MSNTNGQVSFVKSMNGILSFNTGSGIIIEGNTITTNNINTDNIQGLTPSDNITLYTNSTGDIHIGSANSLNYVDGPLYVDNIFGTTTGTAFIYPNVVADINIGSSVIPIIGNYLCTASNHLANKGYVDSILNLLPLTNVWTGTSNTFNNKIVVNTIEALNVSSTVNLYNNLTTGSLNLANGMTTGAIAIGNNSMTGNLILRTTGQLLLGNVASNIELGTTSSIVNTISMGNTSTSNLNLGSTMIGGQINIGSVLTTGAITMGGASQTGAINIRTTGALNMGTFSSAIQIGTSTCPSISIGNTSTTSLDLKTPINPNYDTKYTAGSGCPAGCIGEILSFTSTASISVQNSQINILNLAITNIGVYLINVNLIITANTAVTLVRLQANVGYGASGGTGSGVTIYRMIDNAFLASGAGSELTMTFSAVYTVTTVTSPNNFLTVSAIGPTTAIAVIVANIGSKITATRIA